MEKKGESCLDVAGGRRGRLWWVLKGWVVVADDMAAPPLSSNESLTIMIR